MEISVGEDVIDQAAYKQVSSDFENMQRTSGYREKQLFNWGDKF